ncbi:oxalurate catabolism protein HpxZ [Breoghania sp. L-A4]|uniref:oxalurate catabolism protein HpxZ n=1 Tax=Breoghania sp. L-A4 TaxID=2304600 RepID=UPI000E35C32C|nr:oxalurate catabolism protein HpxZ [Breoghania sp. L-A4]AXS40939.1 oxalurate catabolism protein HpxZ [Breoghania sp. L-A4]
MQIDIPEVKAEVEAAFAAYEAALVGNDVAVLDTLFLNAPTTIRYGASENLYGYDEIAAFRAARPSKGLQRTLSRTVITTYGRDAAVASTLYYRESAPDTVGRQMQTWIRTGDGWKVAAAHVSTMDQAAPAQ